jgi:hypothetical protein
MAFTRKYEWTIGHNVNGRSFEGCYSADTIAPDLVSISPVSTP